MTSANYLFGRFFSKSPLYWRLSKLLPVKPDYRGLLLQRVPQNGRCAEIGVWKGEFSQRIIEITQPEILHLVDPWLFQPQLPRRRYGGKHAKNQNDMDTIYDEVSERFANLENVRIYRQKSTDYFEKLDATLDWIYIDGDHRKDSVLEDLCRAWDCIRVGGTICGDDYFWRDNKSELPVKEAVDQFCHERGCLVDLIGSQYIIKRT